MPTLKEINLWSSAANAAGGKAANHERVGKSLDAMQASLMADGSSTFYGLLEAMQKRSWEDQQLAAVVEVLNELGVQLLDVAVARQVALVAKYRTEQRTLSLRLHAIIDPEPSTTTD